MDALNRLAALLLAVALIPLMEFGAALLPCQRHYALRTQVYAMLRGKGGVA